MANHDHQHRLRRNLHKDWRAWLAIILMLVAIITYVLTLDDSIVPR